MARHAEGRTERVLEREVQIAAGEGEQVGGTLTLPPQPHGLVIFAHGSGSSRRSMRNRFVAGVLNGAGFATLLMDLLTAREEVEDRVTAAFRFDIALLARRLIASTRTARSWSETHALPVGYFGASTGAAAALVAAARVPADVAAVVSRGGRPDLAAEALPAVRAPSLFIVGSEDLQVLELNRAAIRAMRARTELAIVPGATHLFEEPGTLEQAASLARDWFARCFEPLAGRDVR